MTSENENFVTDNQVEEAMNNGNVASDNLVNALADVIKSEVTPEMQSIKGQVYQRIADSTEVKSTRIPAPLNITELGGYFNLIDQVGGSAALEDRKAEMKLALIASALGLPVK